MGSAAGRDAVTDSVAAESTACAMSVLNVYTTIYFTSSTDEQSLCHAGRDDKHLQPGRATGGGPAVRMSHSECK